MIKEIMLGVVLPIVSIVGLGLYCKFASQYIDWPSDHWDLRK